MKIGRFCLLLGFAALMWAPSVQAESSTSTKPSLIKSAPVKAAKAPDKNQGKGLNQNKTVETKTATQEQSDKNTAKQNSKEAEILKAKVMNPSQFSGMASFGYAAAQACPEVMAKLFCYCGCDLTDNHSSLLDCFTCNHGVDCHICQEEAVMALKLHKDGVPDEQIQKQIDDRYSSEYPFQEDTLAYRKYKATRYGQKSSSKFGQMPAGPEPTEGTTQNPPKTKSGKSFKPSCCSGAEHKGGSAKP